MLDSTIAYDLTFLVPAGDTAVGASLRMYGEFARVELDFLKLVAGDDGVLIDVGANVGAIALPFAKALPAWSVLAIEAQSGIATLLAANVANNRLYNVAMVHAAAGATAGLVDFPTRPLSARLNYGAVGFADTLGPVETVRMLTLDDVAPSDTRIVKIDVEGFEPEVLKGAEKLVDAQRAVWMIEATGKHPEARAEVIGRLQRAGYAVHWFYAPFATPLSPKAQPGNPGTGDVNMVALPPGMVSPWPLAVIGRPDELAPTTIAGYPYLEPYGYLT